MTLPIRALALLQLAVILGIAAGLGFSQWQTRAQIESRGEASRTVPEVELPHQDPSPPVEVSSTENPGPVEEPRTLAEWLEGEPVPVSSGDGQIDGIVLLDGEPLEGLELTASVVIPTDGEEDADLLDQILAGVKSMRLRKSLERTTTSDESGRFTLTDLGVEFTYYINSDDYFLSPADRQRRAPYPTGIDLELKARAKKDGNSNTPAQQRPWATGGLDETVLVGTIQNMTRGNLYLYEGHGPPPEPIDGAPRLNSSRGIFSKALDPGPYTLIAAEGFRREGKVINSWPIEVKPGFNLIHLYLDSLPAMEVLVSNASGEPIVDAQFKWVTRGEHSRGRNGCRPIKVEGHRYFLLPHANILKIFSGALERQAFLEVSAPGQATVEIPIDRIETIEVNFGPVSYLDIDIIGYSGSGLEGLLSFHLESQDGGPSARGTIDWLGFLRLGPVTPGRYQLQTSVKIGGSRHETHRIAEDPVHLVPGENTIAITLPTLYELTLDFDDELLGKRGELIHTQSSIPQRFTASRGLHLRTLIAGEYRVRIGEVSKLVHIPQESSVFIPYEAFKFNAMLIKDILAGTPAAASGLQIGDQVIAFNGVTFEEMEGLNAAAGAAATDTQVTLTLIRNHIEIELTVSPADLEGILPDFIRR